LVCSQGSDFRSYTSANIESAMNSSVGRGKVLDSEIEWQQ